MAIWQFEFYTADKNKANKDDPDDIILWDDMSAELAENVPFLNKKESWDASIVQFGNADETCIEILKENDKIAEISVRIDMRSITERLLSDIIEYLKRINCRIYYNEKFYDVTLDNLKALMVSSDAYSFCKDPQSFLENI